MEPLGWRGADTGVLSEEAMASALGDQVVLADIDDDGVSDLLVAGGAAGLAWVKR